MNLGTGLALIPGCAYQFDADWGVMNRSSSTNSEDGIFEIFINGATIGSASAGFMAANSFEWGHISGVRKISISSNDDLIIRILRPYTFATSLTQYLDNVSIGPAILDGTFDSQSLASFTIFGTSNGQSTDNAIASGPLNTWNARMRIGQFNSTPGVEEGVDITQPADLNRLTKCRLDFSYAARNSGKVANAQGGLFQVVVDGVVRGSAFSIGSIAAGTSITGTGSATFIVSSNGAKNVGIRVTRHFLPNNSVFQYVDNIRISKVTTQISGVAELQNWEGGEYAPVHFIFEEGGLIVGEAESSRDDIGNYSCTTPLRGITNIFCKSTHWLSKITWGYSINDSANLPANYSLVNGDTDADNEVNLVDFTHCGNSFGLDADDYQYHWYSDVDGDSYVTLIDLSIISARFGQSGEWFF